MVLVDSSVLIAYFRNAQSAKTDIFRSIIGRNLPFGISFHAYQEVLQGSRNEREFAQLRESLDSLRIYSLPDERATYERAARLYYDLRRKGITIRGSFDILIALTAMEYDLMLLHDDRDFDAIASKTNLEILDEF